MYFIKRNKIIIIIKRRKKITFKFTSLSNIIRSIITLSKLKNKNIKK